MGKIYVYASAMAGAGSKFMAANFAHYTKQQYPGMRVALLDFDFTYPYLAERLALHDSVHSIDNLTDKIDGGFLDDKLFTENMVTLRSGVELLKGTQFAGNYHVVGKSHIDQIMALAKEQYDYVFVAVGSEMHAGIAYSLFHADQVFAVAQNNYANFRRMPNLSEVLGHCTQTGTPIHFIINQYVEASDVVFTEFIEAHRIQHIELVPYIEEAFDHTDLTKGLIASKLFKQRKQAQDVFEQLIAKHIIHTSL